MTVNVRSRAIGVLTLKISKNVKSVEFDHKGAYSSEVKHGKISLLLLYFVSGTIRRQKVLLKVFDKWRRFCLTNVNKRLLIIAVT